MVKYVKKESVNNIIMATWCLLDETLNEKDKDKLGMYFNLMQEQLSLLPEKEINNNKKKKGKSPKN